MLPQPRSKRLPYLSQFVDYSIVELRRRLPSVFRTPIFGVIAGSVLVGTVIQGMMRGPGWAIFLIWGLGAAALTAADYVLKVKALERSPHLKQQAEALKVYAEKVESNRLHKDLDYSAAQLLEATAYHWVRIQEALAAYPWSGPEASMHLRAMKDEILSAANDELAQSVMLCQRTFIPEGTQRNALSEIVDDLVNLDLEGVLDGFKQSLKGKKVYNSDRFHEVAQAVRMTAEKMSHLSAKVDRLTRDASLQPVLGAGAGSRIDEALRTISEVQIAEQELLEEPRLRIREMD